MRRSFELIGLDGANPLGFLAALGTLVSVDPTGQGAAQLRWKQSTRWRPVLEGIEARDEQELAARVADSLRGSDVSGDAEKNRKAAEQAMDEAKRALEKKREELKKRGLRGAQRAEAEDRELRPLELHYEAKRRQWLETLRAAVPRPELALGKSIDCTSEEYREHAAALVSSAAPSNREALDMLAGFGSDAVRQRNSERIASTPFCFTKGSGKQYFLDSARQLVGKVSPEAVQRTLFQPWDYRDEGLSMRWDPVEDRRYALLDRDPSEESVRTVWMANLLGYRAIALFPTAPVGGRLHVAGWDPKLENFTWPLWEVPLGLEVVRSLVQLRDLVEDKPDASTLRARGIVAVFRAARIEVGSGGNKKLNFTPARRVA
jgi:hypothetical protein